MRLDDEFTAVALSAFFRQCETAKKIGISELQRFKGVEIPIGWRLDFATQYWLPPNVVLF